jgi:hypothetical protein
VSKVQDLGESHRRVNTGVSVRSVTAVLLLAVVRPSLFLGNGR